LCDQHNGLPKGSVKPFFVVFENLIEKLAQTHRLPSFCREMERFFVF